MIRWSPIKLKFTLGIGSLASAALFCELAQKAVPTWLAVGIIILPFAVPDDGPRSVADSRPELFKRGAPYRVGAE